MDKSSPEWKKIYRAAWYAKHPDAKRNERRGLYRRLRAAVLAFYGNKCVQCGFSDIRALQIDHINGGGNKHRKGKSGIQYLRSILKTPEKFQILCSNCNWIKRAELGEDGFHEKPEGGE